jgi:hypothetical protein
VKAFIVSDNIKRRHLNAGQRAMAVAMMYPEGTPGKKTETSLAELRCKSKMVVTYQLQNKSVS